MVTVKRVIGIIVELPLDNELGARLQQLFNRFDTVEVQIRPLVPIIGQLESLLTPPLEL